MDSVYGDELNALREQGKYLGEISCFADRRYDMWRFLQLVTVPTVLFRARRAAIVVFIVVVLAFVAFRFTFCTAQFSF